MFCPQCGKENIKTAKFCKNCGKPLPDRTKMVLGRPTTLHTPAALTFLGQVLDGKYFLTAKLGSGGMGDVYRATRMLIGDEVAVKILHAHLANNPEAAERFRREAQTAIHLKHRNVVALYDVGISAAFRVPYILMELAEGFTLRQLINQWGVLPLEFAVTVTTQVCAALDEAHRLGIIHRDVKPENIMAHQTTTGWQVKVLDFGIAKFFNRADSGLTLDGSSMGTPQYMSPEQCLGENIDLRSDIYSVGITLYEMLTGTTPFKSPAASAIAIQQVQTPPVPPRSINGKIAPQVETVVLRALAKRREMRPQTAGALAKELIEAATVAFQTGVVSVPSTRLQPPPVQEEREVLTEFNKKPFSPPTPGEAFPEKAADEPPDTENFENFPTEDFDVNRPIGKPNEPLF